MCYAFLNTTFASITMDSTTLGLILIYAVIFPIIGIVAAYNKLVKGRNKVAESKSSLLIYLKKRFNLVHNLVRIVKAYSQHEYQSLVDVIKERNSEGSLESFKAVAEAYPDLKADKQYQSLMDELTSLEDELAEARLRFNKLTRKYNDLCMKFPVNLIANFFKFKPSNYFEADETGLKDISLSFDSN